MLPNRTRVRVVVDEPFLILPITPSFLTEYPPLTMARTRQVSDSELEPWDGINDLVFGSLGNAQGFEKNVSQVDWDRAGILTSAMSSVVEPCDFPLGRYNCAARRRHCYDIKQENGVCDQLLYDLLLLTILSFKAAAS